ncbi:MAG TPA: helix-turn-helix domain-containing protein [Chryseolinea sp.]|nr:helix-turn-helix domain-containing protein [Chryseolinea sp.]
METGLLQETTTKAKHAQCEKAILPVRDALDVLNGKWKLQIILALTFSNLRFKEMQRQIHGITAKMLSKELKELEVNQLVKRTVYDSIPVTVEYALTPYGRTLKKVILELGSWGKKHREKIMGKGK